MNSKENDEADLLFSFLPSIKKNRVIKNEKQCMTILRRINKNL
ncbi:hypothetical protein RV15_GL003330 [Enterococcus silesiacus]|uniref:Uncharacterized protein n=1 Tax=Enterococcus silesiacus TaxID=332949 RepID=A0AA91GBC6_9ENTE|nr:hypothetical protein RV15_GL003330 [Enterococcus silesiacus]